jgi:prevent-host-death family protein
LLRCAIVSPGQASNEETIAKRWQVHEARAKFDTLIEAAIRGEPQTVTRHGRDIAVVISVEEYARLSARSRGTLLEFLSSFGSADLELPERDRTDTVREIDF